LQTEYSIALGPLGCYFRFARLKEGDVSIRGRETVKKEEEVSLAWSIWNLANDLCEQLWERYEDEFFDLYMEACENERDDAVRPKPMDWSSCWGDGSTDAQGAGRRSRE
jgi:hypothetical protein